MGKGEVKREATDVKVIQEEMKAEVKREETDASLSSDDGATVVSSHPNVFVDLRVVIWIEVSIYLTGRTVLIISY